MKKLRKAFSITPRQWADLSCAIVFLAVARIHTVNRSPATLLAQGDQLKPDIFKQPESTGTKRIIDRVSWAIPVAAQHVPWRSDCLVQALAAQRWLVRAGIQSDLFIGVKKNTNVPFEAHAWLLHEGKTVTGGEFSSFTPLVTPD